jgi:YVTN family beta-propeller protein
VDPYAGIVYVVNVGFCGPESCVGGTVSVIDIASGTVTRTFPVGIAPDAVAADPAAQTAYVVNSDPGQLDGTVLVMAVGGDYMTETIPVGISPVALAVDPAAGTVYVVNFTGGPGDSDGEGTDGTVSMIDEATGTVTGTIPVGYEPAGVAVDAAAGAVYVTGSGDCDSSGCFSGGVSVIDVATGTVTGTIPVGGSPGAVAVDPGTRTIYVTNSGAVSVADAATGTVTATIAVGGSPGAVAVDPGTHTAYVTNESGRGTVSVISR